MIEIKYIVQDVETEIKFLSGVIDETSNGDVSERRAGEERPDRLGGGRDYEEGHRNE